MSAASELDLQSLTKVYGEQRAVDEVSLTFDAGTYVVLLGPSGSGKTTLLAMIGGFTPPTQGRIVLGGEDITLAPPRNRPTATVFQDYALFPHMSVADNVGFGLSVRRLPRAEINQRVRAALSLVDLDGLGARPISAASGGQRQRIALARALVTEPSILLLDEPLGALDLHLRRQMQDELRHLQRREGRTFVHVTHDQEEAMAIADLIVIMNAGRVEDSGPPERVYSRPKTRFSAQFMGESTILDAKPDGNGRVETPLGALPTVGEAGYFVGIRPEKLLLTPSPNATELGTMTVNERVFQGSFARLTGTIEGIDLRVRADPSLAPAAGETARVYLAPDGAVLLEE
ncbi:MAG: ABC transporter ATP-binding protein [Pseudomonadota bacterium]